MIVFTYLLSRHCLPLFSVSLIRFCQGEAMSDDNQNPERDIYERIARRMQAIGQSSSKQIPSEQLLALKIAASRLDQILQSNADQEQQSLKSAALKLDQLLSNISKRKDVTHGLKRRRDHQNKSE